MEITAFLLLVFFSLFFTFTLFTDQCKKKLEEHFGAGAMTQLFAKGPEDSYLSFDTDKYVPEYTPGLYPWRYYLWNAPTRLGDYLHDSYSSFSYGGQPYYRY